MKASEIIKTQCCANLLEVPKCELVAKVEKLEAERNKLAIEFIHGAAKHLERVVRHHPYCDHVQVVKHYANMVINPELFNDEDLPQ